MSILFRCIKDLIYWRTVRMDWWMAGLLLSSGLMAGLLGCEPKSSLIIRPAPTPPASVTATTPASVTVTAPLVYVASFDNNLYALDTATGTQRWVFRADTSIQSSPVVAYGMVYIGSNDNKLYAIDATTGQKRWAFQYWRPCVFQPGGQ